MASYNKVILMGNLTRDPELSYLPSQTPVTEIGLAINHRWKSQDGQQRESVCFIDCRCYGRQAEILKQYTAKGRPLLIEGRLDLDQWEAQDGSKRSKHRVFIERFTFVDSRPGGGQAQGTPYQAPAPATPPPAAAPPTAPPPAAAPPNMPPPPPDANLEPPGEDNIPF